MSEEEILEQEPEAEPEPEPVITHGYCTLAELRERIPIPDGETGYDAILAGIIEAASRWIELPGQTGRHFYTSDEDEVRYYSAEYTDVLFLNDDVSSITTLKTDNDGDGIWGSLWTEDVDFYLTPFNETPKRAVWAAPGGAYRFPRRWKGVQITGRFGWPEVPAPIREACLLQSARLFHRKDAVFGVSAPGQFGQMIVKLPADPDVASLLEGYRRML